MLRDKFWEKYPLEELNQQEWEALCDGCARCCMHKLQDDETDEIFYTSVVCRYLEQDACHCTVYPQRHIKVPDCVVLDKDTAYEFSWLPTTCAYRVLAEGEPLAHWHPLISGNKQSVQEAGIAVTGKVISEENVPPEAMEDYLIDWIEF